MPTPVCGGKQKSSKTEEKEKRQLRYERTSTCEQAK